MTGDQQNQQQEYTKQWGGQNGGGNPFADMFGGGGRQTGNKQGNYLKINFNNIF